MVLGCHGLNGLIGDLAERLCGIDEGLSPQRRRWRLHMQKRMLCCSAQATFEGALRCEVS